MRVWRSSQGFIVEGSPSPEGLDSLLLDQLPAGPWHERREYTLIDGQGRVRRTLRMSVGSIEDELCAQVHAVVDGALRELSVSVFCSRSYRVVRREREIEGGLQDASADAEALRIVERALADDARRQSEEAGRRTREADARMADLPGALEDYGAGPDFRAAQNALIARYRSYGDALDRAILGTLARFGRLHRSLRGDAKALAACEIALAAYVVACRLLHFDRTLVRGEPVPLPAAGAFAGLPAELKSEVNSLARSLYDLDRTVNQHAEWQEDVDARGNAIAMWKACGEIVRARQALETP